MPNPNTNKIFRESLEKVITTLWIIWKNRNNDIFDNHKCNHVNTME